MTSLDSYELVLEVVNKRRFLMTNRDQRGFLHLGETQGVESDPQNSGS